MSIQNSDLLYLYDAKDSNPNGDPDEENKPRMDEATGRNLVSDVRMKRYLRDYLLNRGTDIWVRRTEEGATTDAKTRMTTLLNEYNSSSGKSLKQREARSNREFIDWLLDKLIDIRLFGATMPMENTSITFTGPIQFTWGYSLHPVQINPSSTISSHFAGRENEYGTFGKDWRVYYSLIGFYGLVSSTRARHTRLTEDDISTFDKAMLDAIPEEATTRSKIGQTPRLYLRIEYSQNQGRRLGDLREDVRIEPKGEKTVDTLRDVRDYRVNTGRLTERIQNRQEGIQKASLYVHPDLDSPVQSELQEILGDRLVLL